MRNESAVPSEGGRAPRGGRWPLPWEPGGGVQFVKQRLVGNSAWALSAPAAIVAHAAGSGPLLVEGEPGAGKQFVARLGHLLSVPLGHAWSLGDQVDEDAEV